MKKVAVKDRGRPKSITTQRLNGYQSVAKRVSRRGFLGNMLLVSAALAFTRATDLLTSRGWLQAADVPGADLLHDTFNGLLAFIVPGPDDYSVAQGVSTVEPGGVDESVTDILIATLDETTPFLPQFSATVAGILNGIALVVNPSSSGQFLSPFACLSFAEKAAVFQIMDGTDSLKPLAGVLPAFVAFFCYSEAAVFDPVTRSLTGHPIAWDLSSYQGVSDGRNGFLGYFENRRQVREGETVCAML
jgi:hypothetical protein